MGLMSRIGQSLKKFGVAFAATFAARDHLLFGGLILMAYGLSLVWMPLAFIVPGAVLVGVAVFGVR